MWRKLTLSQNVLSNFEMMRVRAIILVKRIIEEIGSWCDEIQKWGNVDSMRSLNLPKPTEQVAAISGNICSRTVTISRVATVQYYTTLWHMVHLLRGWAVSRAHHSTAHTVYLFMTLPTAALLTETKISQDTLCCPIWIWGVMARNNRMCGTHSERIHLFN